MNREKQIIKDIENKQLQAREEYAKNKARLSESLVKEKTNDYIPQHQNKPENEIKEEKEK